MSTESVVFNDLKIKVLRANPGTSQYTIRNHHYDPFCCFYLAEVKSYAEITKAVEDRVGSQYPILKISYEG